MFRDTVSSPQVGIISTIRAGAFWGAILLPFVYLPMLAAGLDSLTEQLVFTALLSLNAVLLIVGHSHRTN